MNKTPWAEELVRTLNATQRSRRVHPYTCENRGDGNHPFEPEYGDTGVLRATENGWICPYCDYTQDWAH